MQAGIGEITLGLGRVEAGDGDERTVAEIAGWLRKVTDGKGCFLAVEEQRMVASVLDRFPEEVAAHLELGRCPRPRALELPKLVGLRDGKAVYDHDHARKRPDWTYPPA
jgi:hypothetical protein